MHIILVNTLLKSSQNLFKNMNNNIESPLTFSGVVRSDGTVEIPQEARELLKDSGEVEITISFKRETSDEISEDEVLTISKAQKLEVEHVRVMMAGEGRVEIISELGERLQQLLR